MGAAALLSALGGVLGQTPGSSHPSTTKNLGAVFNTTEVTPNILLSEELVDDYAPTTYLDESLTGTYMVMLVDLAIPQSSITTTGPEFYPGLVYCRTTRLHWYQGNLTQTSNGTFASNSSAIATYGGPAPGLDDIAHTYTFYLFKQPDNFTLPAWDAGRTYNPISVYDRMNFSVDAIAAVAGAPIAANYFRVQDPNNTAYGTADNGTCPLNSTTTATPTRDVASTGAAMRSELGWGLALVAVATVAFSML
ncbi:hypothetical protein LTR85_004100 [Meristemomyces frigidus]|nr:hypothetical protein LTR85_004100 [Meristemomyces frigidus]